MCIRSSASFLVLGAHRLGEEGPELGAWASEAVPGQSACHLHEPHPVARMVSSKDLELTVQVKACKFQVTLKSEEISFMFLHRADSC